MGATILDALVSQVRAAISRAYLIAGLVPALVIALGWKLYQARSIDTLKQQLEPLLTMKSAAFPAAALVDVVFVAIVGALFYGGRGLILRMFQNGPAVPTFVRDHLLAVQRERWWRIRGQLETDERLLTAIDRLPTRHLDVVEKEQAVSDEGVIRDRLDRSRAGRQYVERIAALAASDSCEYDDVDCDLVASALDGLFSIGVPARRDEQNQWTRLYETASGRAVLDRMHATLWRRVLARTAEKNTQPELEEHLAPTRLGNRIAALDDYAERRYGIATSTLWTRLWGTLGTAERQEISNAQLRVEMLGNVTVAFAILGTTVGGWAMYEWARLGAASAHVDWWTVWFIVASACLSGASYTLAVDAVGGVSDAITRFVDLHRGRVLTTFGLVAPKNFEEERAMFEDLSRFFDHAMTSGLDKRPMATKQPAGAPVAGQQPPPVAPINEKREYRRTAIDRR